MTGVIAVRAATLVCIILVLSLYAYNSSCVFSSYWEGERALSQETKIKEKVYPPTVVLCFPLAAILDVAKVGPEVHTNCRPASYFSASRNGKMESDRECMSAVRQYIDAVLPGGMFEEHVLNMTYTLWNMVDLLKFLHLIDGYLYLDEVEEHEDRYSVVISEKIQDDFKCFVIEILAINSSILYEKSKLTSTVLVDPYMEILFNTSLKTMDTGYLFLRDSKTLSSGLESRFLLEFNRSYLIGYETEEKIYEDGTRFETGCTNYSDIGFASRSHAVIDCELKATNDVAKKKCYGKYGKKDCQLTTYSPLLVSSKIHANKLRLAIQLNPEVTILTSKPRVDLAELFSFETGLIGFYLGINLIGIATFYRRYQNLLPCRAWLATSREESLIPAETLSKS